MSARDRLPGRAGGVLLAALSLVSLGACKPELDDTSSLVSAPRILAVQATPAEVTPGADVAYTALYVDASGTLAHGDIDWALCTARKPLTELGPVSPSCLVASADWLLPLGEGPAATATVPKDACRQFGPDTPEAKAGEPAGRPVDPDLTGGYYQPLRLMLGGPAAPSFSAAETRLTCGLAGASQDDLTLFQHRRRPNQNPAPQSLSAGATEVMDQGSFVVSPGGKLTLKLHYPDCPVTPVCGDGVCSPDEDVTGCPDDCKPPAPGGCGGSELYDLFDPTMRTNVLRREAMRVSWFSTAGTFDSPHTGNDADAPGTSSENAWTAPASGEVTLWAVLRDDRGGVGWLTVTAQVK